MSSTSALASLSYEQRFAQFNWNTSDNIAIPEIFYKRHLTNIEELDLLFGGDLKGLLPIASFTITGSKGAGKTTFLLQYLSHLANQGISVAYISNEEIIFMLSLLSQRLGINNVPLVNMNNIDLICETLKTKKVQVAILDSFPGLITNNTKRNVPSYVLTKIRELTSNVDNPIAVGTVLHLTKAGTFKGSSDICHVVDINLELTNNEFGGKSIKTTKNRTGKLHELSLEMNSKGFIWNNNIKVENIINNNLRQIILDKFNELYAISHLELPEYNRNDIQKELTKMEKDGIVMQISEVYYTKI